LELNKANNLLAVANYSSGNASVFNINSDGSLKESPQVRQHEGSGSSLPNQESAHAHCTKFYKDNLLYVVDLGIDEVASYSIDDKGELGKKETALKTDISDGPRHLIFHPSKEITYLINEISNSIIISTINQKDGSFNRIQKISTLPDDFKGESHCADIHITSNGKFLYASNRGHNSIAMYAVADNGTLTFLGTESVRGNWPRNFTLSKDEKFLLVANQNSGNIVVFGVDDKTGLLSFTGTDFKLSKPVCLKF
jgi:6-phosphogluconolactonase